MENAAQPTSFSRRGGRGRYVLAENGPSRKNCQNEQNKAALHEALNSAKTFLGCKIAVKPLYELANVFAVNRYENPLCIRSLPGFCAH